MDLLKAWGDWQPKSAPYVLGPDGPVLDTARSREAIVNIKGWPQAYSAPDFGGQNDSRLHLGLLPQPFLGDLRRASIYILLLNPGLGPTDYYGEYEVPSYRNALQANLKQRFDKDSVPFLFLDPRFAWHGGFGWWHAKLGSVIQRLAGMWNVSFADARDRLSRQIASVELIPYHSPGFRDAGGWLQQLHSAALARDFVHETVVPRVRAGEAILIATRKTKVWNLPRHKGIVVYSGQQARAAHLSPKSPGGREILAHLAQARS